MSQVFSIFCLQRDTWLISDIEISQSFKHLALTNALQNKKRQNESQAKFRLERMLKDQIYKFEFLESKS